jgi:hypothetical protein
LVHGSLGRVVQTVAVVGNAAGIGGRDCLSPDHVDAAAVVVAPGR